jgi:hypothetical protein
VSVEVGDRVTLAGTVVVLSNGRAQVRLDHDAYIVVPLEAGFHSVEKPPYRPQVGEWFTWGHGSSGYQCLWISDQHVVYGRPRTAMRPNVGDFPDMPKMRPCKDQFGDRQ